MTGATDLPTFLVIGAAKAGTTTVYEHLAVHPQVFVTAQKEIHYFSEHNYFRGLDWYRSLFAEGRDSPARGEASPGYASAPMFGSVPERIAAVVPDVRLIYLIRQPVDRLISNYRQDAHSWGEREPITTALLAPRHLDRSRYAYQIEQYLARFPAESLLVVTTEVLGREPATAMRRIYQHIGVDPEFTPPALDTRYHAAASLRSERGAASRLRGGRLHRTATRLLPDQVRHQLWLRAASRPVDPALLEIEVPEETKAAAAVELRADLERLAELVRRHESLPVEVGMPRTEWDAWGLL